MYVVLSGAKKNAGDFLITDRAEQLLRHFRPERELLRLPAWEPLEPHLDRVNGAAAVIILGGPGLQPQLYPKVYKLTRNLDDIKVPIILMGSGWKAFPGDADSLARFAFSAESLTALRKMSAGAKVLSCRDIYSAHLLRRYGISNVAMTGCPVWYDLQSIGKAMRLPESMGNIVFTPAQLPFYRDVSIRVAQVLRQRFPAARLICAFHRGIGKKDEFMNDDEAANNVAIEAAARDLGYEISDLSGATEGSSIYDQCDFHLGFRLHAHLYTLSKRVPSLLLHEDGRGVAASATLNLQGFDAFKRTFVGRLRVPTSRLRRIVEKKHRGLIPDVAVGDRIGNYLDHLISTGFAACAGTGPVIDAHFEGMKRFIAGLP